MKRKIIAVMMSITLYTISPTFAMINSEENDKAEVGIPIQQSSDIEDKEVLTKKLAALKEKQRQAKEDYFRVGILYKKEKTNGFTYLIQPPFEDMNSIKPLTTRLIELANEIERIENQLGIHEEE